MGGERTDGGSMRGVDGAHRARTQLLVRFRVAAHQRLTQDSAQQLYQAHAIMTSRRLGCACFHQPCDANSAFNSIASALGAQASMYTHVSVPSG